MERRGFPADFALNHPAGSLGKQLTLTAADLMVPAAKLHPLLPHTPLPDVIGGLTRDGIGSGWVEHPDRPGPQSIITEAICAGPFRITALRNGPPSKLPI